MKFQGFIGPSYTLRTVNVDAQRCVNMYPEMVESGVGKSGDIAYLASTPGLRKIFTVGTGPIRLVQVDDPVADIHNPPNRVFVVSGNQVFKCIYDGTTWTNTVIGTIGTSTGPVRAASLQINLGITVFVDGNVTYLYWRYNLGDGTATESFGPFADYGYPSIPNSTHVILADSYLIYIQAGKNTFYVSDYNTFTVNPLSFASAEGDPDNIVSVITNHRELWLLNERTIEVFYNSGNAAFPYDRIQGGFIEKGCLAPNSVAKIDGTIMWLGRESVGQGVVYAAMGLVPVRISTHAVETAISKYANPSNATAYTYENNGHSFYVLNFDEGTWAFDLSTKLWHERAYTNAGAFERHRANYHSFMSPYNLHIVGDYANGNIYALDDAYYSDDTAAITRLRTFPHLSNGLMRLFCKSLQIDMETGVGLDGSGQGSDPQMVLQYSDDGGHTWSSELWASAGKSVGGIGDYNKRVIWRRLGSFRDRIFRVQITDPVKVSLISAEIDVESGHS